jgi:hypothetical protein
VYISLPRVDCPSVLVGHEQDRLRGLLKSQVVGAGYRVRSATVEKVLVRDLPEVAGEGDPARRGKVPFDAMTWFRLERTPAG